VTAIEPTEEWAIKSWSGRQEYVWDTSLAKANPTSPHDEIVNAVLAIYPIGGHDAPFNGDEIIPSELCANGTLITVTLDRGRRQQYTLFLKVATAGGGEYSWFVALPSQAFAGIPAPVPPQFYFGSSLTWRASVTPVPSWQLLGADGARLLGADGAFLQYAR
jgi:hypothetical protein